MALSLKDFLVSQGYLPIQLIRNTIGHLQLPIILNGKPAHFILDTGASRTVIDRTATDQFALDMISSTEKAGGVGTSEHEVSFTVVNQLSLGSLTFTDKKIAVIDLSHVNNALVTHGGEKIDGVIGGELLIEGNAIIDCVECVLYMR